eukprot:EG_transcript_3657
MSYNQYPQYMQYSTQAPYGANQTYAGGSYGTSTPYPYGSTAAGATYPPTTGSAAPGYQGSPAGSYQGGSAGSYLPTQQPQQQPQQQGTAGSPMGGAYGAQPAAGYGSASYGSQSPYGQAYPGSGGAGSAYPSSAAGMGMYGAYQQPSYPQGTYPQGNYPATTSSGYGAMGGAKPAGPSAPYPSGGYGTYGQSSTYPASTQSAYGQSPSYGQSYGQGGSGYPPSTQGAYTGSYPQSAQGNYQTQPATPPPQSGDYGQKDYGQRDYGQKYPQSGASYGAGAGYSDGYGRRQDYMQQPQGSQQFQGRRSDGGWQSDRADDRYRSSGQGYGSYGQQGYQQQQSSSGGWGRAYEASQTSNFNQRQQPQWSQPDSGPAREDGAHRADGLLKPSDESGQPQTGSAGADAATPPPESSPSSSRVVQLAGLSFGQVERIPVDIVYRCPRLQVAADFQKIVCHYADHTRPFPPTADFGSNIQILEESTPYVEPFSEEVGQRLEMAYDTDGQKQEPPLRHVVRVMLPTSNNEPGRHLCRRLSFVVLKCNTGKWCVPGGQYSSEIDGPDPFDDATLAKAACRVVQAQIGMDLAQCRLHKFIEVFYETGSARTRVVFLIPEVWAASEPLKAYSQVKEVATPYTAQEEVEEDMTEEDIENFNKQWRDSLEQERIAMAAVIPGEREVDRLERLDKFEEEMKHKEDHPPVPPKTKKVMRSVEKQRVNKVATLIPAYASLIDLAEYQQPSSLSTEDFNSIFEVKLFALCFDEMLRLHFSSSIIGWMKEYPLKKQAEATERELKRKREEDWAARRAAKRQRLE